MAVPRIYTAALILALITLSGCAHSLSPKDPALQASDSPFEIFNGEYVNTIAMTQSPPTSIAVLPFTGDPANWSMELDGEEPPEIVRRGFYNQMASLPYRDQELHVTRARLERAGLYTPEDIRSALDENPQSLASALGVDAAVTGEVTHFDRVFAGLGSQVAVGCEVRMIDLKTGNLLWQAKHVSRGFAGGVSITPIGMALNAVASLWNLRQVQLYRETDNLFREMVSTIHVPDNLAQGRPAPPAIALFAAVNADRTFGAGDLVQFRLVGDPGHKAWVDVAGLSQSVTLDPVPKATAQALRRDIVAEARAGHEKSGLPFPPEAAAELEARLAGFSVYQGSLTVPQGFEAENATATAGLASDQGGLARRVHPGGLSFDAKAPKAPEELRAKALSGKVDLAWSPVQDAGPVEYEIWLAPRDGADFQPAATSRTARAVIQELTDFDPLLIKVRAVDQAGNQGPFSPAVETMPAPEPGLADLPLPGPVLSGDIGGRVFLPAHAGPYRVQGTVTVTPGGRLIIGPGTALGFASGAGMVVKGGELAVYGQKDRPVKMEPLEPSAKPGSHTGLILDGARSALLRHLGVFGARVGITVKDSSPDMAGVKISGSSQAGLHLLDNAAPCVTNSAIVGNSGMGGLVMEGAGLAPSIRSSVFSQNHPFDVQSYARVTIDLSGNYWTSRDQQSTIGNLRLKPALETRPEAAP